MWWLIILIFIPDRGESAEKCANYTRSVAFQEGRCYQACLDESNLPGKLDAKGKCYCYSEMPLEYMNAKKSRTKVKLDATKEDDHGF